MPAGQPTLYNDKLADLICKAISTSDKGLDHLYKEIPDFPHPSTVYLWVATHPKFSEKYFAARRAQAQVYAESTIDIAQQKATYIDEKGNERVDAGHVSWQKLNVSVRQWHASKLAPKIYGDQKQIEELRGENDRVKAELADLRSKLDKVNVSDY